MTFWSRLWTNRALDPAVARELNGERIQILVKQQPIVAAS